MRGLAASILDDVKVASSVSSAAQTTSSVKLGVPDGSARHDTPETLPDTWSNVIVSAPMVSPEAGSVRSWLFPERSFHTAGESECEPTPALSMASYLRTSPSVTYAPKAHVEAKTAANEHNTSL